MLKELFLKQQELLPCSIETLQILRLIRSENVGPRTFINLIKIFGNAGKALENVEEFSLKGGRAKPIKLYSESDAARELESLAKNNAKILSYKSSEYSKLLLQIPDFPPIISYKGNIDLLNSSRIIAMVGARNASINGKVFASKISKELSSKGYVIVSGLARGIDTAAHTACPANTVAVIAGGIDHIYPPENAGLYKQIAEEGLIVAELAVGTKPLGQHFPQRNRIISGLSLGTLVIEASLKSGSLITATQALDQNREVFAVPGFPMDPRSHGTNKLIKDGAILVESIDDIIDNLPNQGELKNLTPELNDLNNDFKHLGSSYLQQINNTMRRNVLESLSATPINLEDLVSIVELPLQIIHVIILEYELAGKVNRHPGNNISLKFE